MPHSTGPENAKTSQDIGKELFLRVHLRRLRTAVAGRTPH
jgi:hypothetical protein